MLLQATWLVYVVTVLLLLHLGPVLWAVLSLVLLGVERLAVGSGAKRQDRAAVAVGGMPQAADSVYPVAVSPLVAGILFVVPVTFFGIWMSWAGVWMIAELAVMLTEIFCVIWWLRLRRSGIAGAEVYAVVFLIATYSVWMLVAATNPSVVGPRCSTILGTAEYAWIGVAWSVIVVTTVLCLTWPLRKSVNLLLLLIMGSPSLGVFWFVFPFGPWHLGFTVAIAGYAMAREVRRLNDSAITETDSSPSTSMAGAPDGVLAARLDFRAAWAKDVRAVGLIATLLAATVAVAVSSIAFFANEAGEAVQEGTLQQVVMQIQVVALGLAALAGLWLLAKAGAVMKYGAMLLGWIWMLVVYAFFIAPDFLEWGSTCGMERQLGVTLAAMLTLYAMWRVFGPGAVVDEQRTG